MEWLAQICSRDPNRAWLASPIKAEVDGSPVTIATDGHRMVVVDGHVAEAVAQPAGGGDVVPVASAPVKGKPVDAVKFRGWVMLGWLRCRGAKCRVCTGSGFVTCLACDGRIRLDCTCHCGHEHGHQCVDCRGGKRPCTGLAGGARPERDRLGWIGKELFDLDLLAPMVEHVKDKTIWLEVAGQQLRIRGAGWKGFLMVRLASAGDEKWPRWKV